MDKSTIGGIFIVIFLLFMAPSFFVIVLFGVFLIWLILKLLGHDLIKMLKGED